MVWPLLLVSTKEELLEAEKAVAEALDGQRLRAHVVFGNSSSFPTNVSQVLMGRLCARF